MSKAMRQLSLKIALAAAAICCSESPCHGGFDNGGFETGDWTGWTLGGGAFIQNADGVAPQYLPGSHEYEGLTPVVASGRSAVVPTDERPVYGSEYGFLDRKDFKTLYNLNRVFSGTKAARVNDWRDGYQYSTISQHVTDWNSDKLYFSWAAVLELPDSWNTHENKSPAEPKDVGPHFTVELKDNVSGLIFKDTYTVYTLLSKGVRIHEGEKNSYDDSNGLHFDDSWLYTDWQIAALNTQGIKDFTITILASDCGWGGHGGYVYVDSFGSTVPVPEPSTWLAGLAALGMLGYYGFKGGRFS